MTASTPAGPIVPAAKREPQIYLDVAAVRIQEWLGRTPPLKFRRGASVLLSEATARSRWGARLPAGVSWNEEAGEISGVVSLRVTPTDATSGATGGTVRAAALPVARQVVRELRGRLPHCSFQAVAASAVSYADAYPDLARARRSGDLLVDSPAPGCEMVLAKPCDVCRSAPAVHDGVRVVDEDLALCVECGLRHPAGGLTRGDWQARSPLSERRLLARLQELHPTVVGFSDDFFELATAGKQAAEDAATQLATVYADGNQVGDFLSKAAQALGARAAFDKSMIVRAIDTATREALAVAVGQTFVTGPRMAPAPDGTDRLGSRDDGRRPPILVHLADGDDLLTSVPAGDGWRFVRTLVRAFDTSIAGTATAWDLADLRLPSLSAGLVFHHHSHPFSDVVTRAGERLRTAKRDTSGREAAVAFLDLTADGDRPTAGRPTRTAAELDLMSDRLGRLVADPPSRRAAFVGLCRQAADSREHAVDERESAAGALARRVVDLGSPAVWEVAAGVADPTADQVRDALLDDPAAPGRLRHHLDLARWWPAAVGPSGGQEGTS